MRGGTMISIRAALAAAALLAIVSASSACNRDDEEALLALMASFPPNSLPPSWNSSADCCAWANVQCNAGRVYILQINNISAIGPIPPAVGRLTKLRMLFLENLNLSGPIPPQLSTLTDLDTLYLDGNRLTGTIPDALFSRAKSTAIRLILRNNQLTGPIPPSFGRVGFNFVILSNNKLTGDASFLFGKSKKATTIALDRNMLAFNLTNVQYPVNKFFSYLDISHNEIYGSISPQINRVKNLEHFDCSYNRLCGPIPSGDTLAQFDASSFAHNACLCGAPLSPCK